MRKLRIPYSTWKLVLDANLSWEVYESGDGQARELWSGNVDYLYETYVDESQRSDYDAWDNDRTVVPVVSEDEAVAYIIGVGKVVRAKPRTEDGRLRTTSEKTTGSRTNFFSHKYTDPTTWYQKSIRVVDEVATDGGAHTTYSLSHVNMVDVYHGKLTQEDDLKDSGGYSYRVAVKVDDVSKVEQDPHYGTGGDYTVNYSAGTVTFLSARAENAVVKVTYHYATSSCFTVAPEVGKKLQLDIAEVQFSTDVNPTDSIQFQVWGIADFFLSPAQMSAYGIPYGIGYKIQLQKLVYKTMVDFLNDAFRSYPTYLALGDSNNWRAQHQPVTVFDWDYLSSVFLLSSKGMEIRVLLEHDVPYEGYLATATFYCMTEPEG
jgi:hypothetical protein